MTDRATIANNGSEYGATMGFFPVDEETCAYLLATGRSKEHVDIVRAYYKAQGMFGIPRRDECDYSVVLDLDLESIGPSVAGPKRPQDRIELSALKSQFNELMVKPISEGGYGKTEDDLGHAITSRSAPTGNASSRAVANNDQAFRFPQSIHRRTPTPASGPKRKWSTTVRRRTSSPRFLKTSFRLATNWWAMAMF